MTAVTTKSAPVVRREVSPRFAEASGIPGARVVAYAERDVVRVRAKLRYTTLIVLPKNEQIMDYTCGDKEYWVVNGTANFAYVKPAKANTQTNLNLIAASGNVYTFVLTEVSEQGGGEPDMKLFIEPKDESMISSLNGAPRFVPAAQIEDFTRQVEIAKAETREARRLAQDAVTKAQVQVEDERSRLRADYPGKLRHAYRFKKGEQPFLLTAMYHDDKFVSDL